MMKLHCLSFLAILFSVSACAPVNYGPTYRPASGHVSAYRSPQTYIRPIQVTLYSDSTYPGVNFDPIQIVISDGQYVEMDEIIFGIVSNTINKLLRKFFG